MAVLPTRVGGALDDVFADGGDMGTLMRAIDWSATPLGPVSAWSPALRTMLGVLLRNRFPLLLWWGPDLVQLYNDAYRPIPGGKHPQALGQTAKECWAGIWDIIGPMIEGPLQGQPATWSDDLTLLINRKGFLEETHFKVAYSPVPDDTVPLTGIGGVLATVAETTEQVYAARQLKTLRELGARAAAATTPEQACEAAAATLDENACDVSFSLFYLLDQDGTRARLVAQCGFSGTAGPANPALVDLGPGAASEPPSMIAQAVHDRAIQVLTDVRERYGPLPAGCWNEPPRGAMVLPLASPDQPRPYGVLVVGLSPHREVDAGYQTFFELAAAQVVTAIHNARARQEERLRAERLAEIDRAKTAFFSNVSHEFRTPLTLMLGPLEDALSSADRSLRGEALAITHRNALRLMKLVNTLLDFSRIESGRADARYEPADLAAITAELAGVFRSAIERAGLRLVLRCEPLAAPVYVDRDMWEKIVLNLVSNAFKFTFSGEIEVRTRAVGDRAELTVRDTGTGVAPHEVARLFERFHRIEGARARTHEGSGIGLAFVQELVCLHGGDIRAESEFGTGTSFTVRIPMGSAHLPAARIVTAQSPSHARDAGGGGADPFLREALHWLPDPADAPAAAAEHVPTGTEERILVVDDNADLRDYLRRILGARWRVETAPDGASALASATRTPPDLVVSDVMMPGLNGFALLHALRKDARTRAIPVILLSARAGEEATIEGLDSGADDYLTKPFRARELVARVACQLAISAGRRERALLLEREREARKEADLQRQHLVSLFMQAPGPIAMLRGADCVIELANPDCCRVWGRHHDDVIGRPLLTVFPEFEGQGIRGLPDGVLRTGAPYVGREVPARIQHGNDAAFDTVYFNFVYAPLRTIRNEIDGVLVMGSDVTEEVVARQQMSLLHGEAEAANRAKDEFLAMLGHELRNPLAPIVTTLQLLRLRGATSPEQDVLERQVSHLARLVDDLLDVSRITHGKIELRKEHIDLSVVIGHAIELSRHLLQERGNHVDLRVPDRGLGVYADPARMVQVISNLITNATKYSAVGSRIIVEASRTHGRVQLRVTDEGVGIAPSIIDRVFEPFVQQAQTSDRTTGGLGLGLTIVRRIVESHGGTVHASSAGQGHGSEFVLALPAAEPAGEEGTAETSAVARDLRRVPGRRILVVDDNADAAEALRNALVALGHEVDVAHDGAAALRTAETFHPEVAVLDIGLPEMDGYELAQGLRAQRGAARAPHLVAVTGYGRDSDRQRSAAAGFQSHLVKPVDVHELERVVESLPR